MQYKKGLKQADQLLKKHPKHGETKAMKGLICYNMGRKDEGWQFVKEAIRLDITSCTCWHVLGLMHRNEKDWVEATKCFQRAVKLDEKNASFLNDLQGTQLAGRKKKIQNKK